MGRLPTLSLALSLTLPLASACDTVSQKDAPMATNERSQAIAQKGPPTVGTPATIAAKVTEPAAPKKPRTLCAGKLSEAGHAMPKKHISRAAAKNTPELPDSLPVGAGKWTWLNFWAAWCAPCKEEIPRLLAFEQRLAAAGAPFRLSFVSLDDDERQLHDFLEGQPGSGLHASFWLKEGSEREDWLKSAGQKPDAPLPFHLLVDAKGKIRCAIQGAVEDGDYAEISKIVSEHQGP
jgi:thiol-disulfide isomerase/thioredoxin